MSRTTEAPSRILAIGAHPDDIEFGCGGVLLVEAARGSEIALCICSRGEAASNGTPDEREAEAHRAADLLGASVEFLEFGGDSMIEVSRTRAVEIARRIRVFRPDVLLGPVMPHNQHPDHAAVGEMCRDAARLARYGGLAQLRDVAPHVVSHCFGYAVTPSAEPRESRFEIRVDIGAQLERWIALMECHSSQLRTRRYIDLQLARARLLGIEAGVEYAQALFTTEPWLVANLSELPRSVRLF
ncbi:MAG: PIG-L family deacetylase [Chthoniobacterales bacterium]|nr:PIG-L family deacetylase [Chthoniobacterales bacterium]